MQGFHPDWSGPFCGFLARLPGSRFRTSGFGDLRESERAAAISRTATMPQSQILNPLGTDPSPPEGTCNRHRQNHRSAHPD